MTDFSVSVLKCSMLIGPPPLVVEVMGTVCTKRNFMSRNICLFENVFFVVRTQKVRRLVSAGSFVKKG